jgi:hypothetical protein
LLQKSYLLLGSLEQEGLISYWSANLKDSKKERIRKREKEVEED